MTSQKTYIIPHVADILLNSLINLIKPYQPPSNKTINTLIEPSRTKKILLYPNYLSATKTQFRTSIQIQACLSSWKFTITFRPLSSQGRIMNHPNPFSMFSLRVNARNADRKSVFVNINTVHRKIYPSQGKKWRRRVPWSNLEQHPLFQ